MKKQFQPRIKLLITFLPISLLVLIIGFFLVYSIYDQSIVTKIPQKKIEVDKNEKIKFLVFGDSGSGSSEQKKLASLMVKENPKIVLHTGDLAYDRGTPKEIKEKVLDVYKDLFSKAAFYPTLGNHDYLTDNGQPFVDTFDLPDNERYYSFSFASVLFVALDSNSPLNEVPNKMLPWLEKVLSQKLSQNKWVIVYFHHAPYSSGVVHGQDQKVIDKIIPILEKHKVDFVFNGHEHNYQRTCEIYKNRCDKNGIVYIVTGGGGRSLYPVGVAKWFTKVQKSVYHFLTVEAEDCRILIKAVDLTGSVFDKVTKDKC